LIHTRPHGDLFREYRRDFQVDVEKKLKEALAQAKGAYAQAEAQAERAAKEAEKGLREAHVAARAHWGQASAAAKEILMVRVDDQGAIRVTVTKDGEKTVYKFKNKEEFKESEPDLYEQVESLLE
jgi:flagellar motor protein MotB